MRTRLAALALLALSCGRRPCEDSSTDMTLDRRIAGGVAIPPGVVDRLALSKYGDVCRYVGADETDGTWDQTAAYWLQPYPGAPEQLSFARYDLVFRWPSWTWTGTATQSLCPDDPAGRCLRFVGDADGAIELYQER